VTGTCGKRWLQLLDYLKEMRRYRKLKEEALDTPLSLELSLAEVMDLSLDGLRDDGCLQY
jgi:hypothetical protein